MLHDAPLRPLQNAVRSLEVFPARGRPSGTGETRELIVPFGRSAYVPSLRASDLSQTNSSSCASGTGAKSVNSGTSRMVGHKQKPRLVRRGPELSELGGERLALGKSVRRESLLHRHLVPGAHSRGPIRF